MNVYAMITDRILETLAKGVVPWRKPWISMMPRNLVSQKAYRGVNVLLLQSSPFQSPDWLTFNQAKALGGAVKRGVRGTPIVYWNSGERKQKDGTTKEWFVLRYFTIFNVEQTDGIEAPPSHVDTPFTPIQMCEAVTATYKNGPTIEHGGGRAFYAPSLDRVQLPARGAFDSSEEYYSTLFHELTHSTGATHRLARKGVVDAARFTSHAYSHEELVAEVGAAFLCAHAGITPATIDNSAAYIASWSKLLSSSDPRMIVDASAQAARAADLILDRTIATVETSEDVAA